jgi:hypothetical protein
VTPVERAFRAGWLDGWGSTGEGDNAEWSGENSGDHDRVDESRAKHKATEDADTATYLSANPTVPEPQDLAVFREFCSSWHARAHHPKTCEALDRIIAAWS